MTREELIEKVRYTIDTLWNSEVDEKEAALIILNSIFAALKEPSGEMKTNGVNSLLPDTVYCDQPMARNCWQAMLSASPLAPEK